jgi:hypothetical protein
LDWDSGVIQDINQKRKRERELAPEMAQREDNLLKLMSKSLYGEKVHYALELIQNAEDADASSITFIFEKDKVIVLNDGVVFDAEDVDAICSVKPGRKKNKIGFFGVGFKSVFNITNTPQVISSRFNFQIENYIYPRPKSNTPDEVKGYYSYEKGSIFVLPQSEGLPSTPELIENFKEIDDKILLFLEKLNTLNFIDNVNGERWSIKKPSSDDGLVILKDGRTDQTTIWRVFHADLPVSDKEVTIPEGKEGINQTRIIVAFPADEETKDTNKSLTIYCYLPIDKRSDIPFLVQADFVPTVGRGNIQEVDWNKWLLKELGLLAAKVIDQIKEDPSLRKDIYSFIPLKEEVREPLMNILSDAMYVSFKEREIAKTLDKGWDKPSECVIASHKDITNIIPQQDLRYIFGKDLYYVDTEASERAHHILEELGSSILGEKEFVEFLGKYDLISKRSSRWFLDAYAYLNEIFDVDDCDYRGNLNWVDEKKEIFSQLEKTKFILTNQNDLVPLKDPNKPDMLICYPHSMDLSEVNELFTEGELVFLNRDLQLSTIIRRTAIDPEEEEKRKKVHKFFEGVGVRAYFKQSHVIRDVILPKFSSGKYSQYDDLKLYRLVNYIRSYWSTLESEVRNKKLSESIFDEIKRGVCLKCYSYKGDDRVSGYLIANKLYFSKRYGKNEEMEALFKGMENIHFLHAYYLNREARERKKKKRGRQKTEYSWKRFAEMLGVWSSPRVEKDDSWISISGKPGYGWIERKYSPQGVHEIKGDSISSDIQNLIEYCTKSEDLEMTKKRMTILLNSLSNNWKTYQEHCKTTYRYYYYTYQPVSLDSSSFLNYLKTAKWVPTVDDDFCRPEDAFFDSRSNHSLLGDNVKYVNITGSKTFLKDIGINLEPEISQVIEHLKDYRERNNESKKATTAKFEIIYSFLAEKIDPLNLEEIRKDFNKHELFYLPRKDRTWWTPSLVFWRDHSRTFGQLRGYIEHDGKEIYPSKLKDFMLSLGISEKPSIQEALEVLDELRDDIEVLKRIVTKVYRYIDEQLCHTHPDEIDWKEYSFLTKSGRFNPPDKIYYEDDDEYAKEFHDKVEFIYLPVSWAGFRYFFKKVGFSSLAESLRIVKHLGQITEMEGSRAEKVKDALDFVKAYLVEKRIEAYETLTSDGVFYRLSDIEICETTEIKLDLSLNQDNTEPIMVLDIDKEAYYSREENRLYILEGISPFSSMVAKELSRLFKGAENDVFPFLNSILPAAHDEEALHEQLKLFGIEEREEEYAGPEDVELIQSEEKPEEEEEKPEPEKEDEEPPIVEPPPEPKPRKGLINPDDYFPSKRKEFIPYKKIEGESPVIPREVDLKEGRGGTTTPPKELSQRAGTKDAEGIAIQMVLNYEASEGRVAEDWHRQKRIGYDVYSKKPDGEETFIEVKHFREQAGRFRLTPYELKKARLESEKYYVYVVTGLKEGDHQKKLYIIQDPIKWLKPDPPVEQEYTNWQGSVKEEVTFENA